MQLLVQQVSRPITATLCFVQLRQLQQQLAAREQEVAALREIAEAAAQLQSQDVQAAKVLELSKKVCMRNAYDLRYSNMQTGGLQQVHKTSSKLTCLLLHDAEPLPQPLSGEGKAESGKAAAGIIRGNFWQSSEHSKGVACIRVNSSTYREACRHVVVGLHMCVCTVPKNCTMPCCTGPMPVQSKIHHSEAVCYSAEATARRCGR